MSVFAAGRAFRGLRLPGISLLLGIAVACAPDSPTAPLRPQPSALVSDGTTPGGSAAFFWLPPIAPADRTAPAGDFDADAMPSVRICRLVNDACAEEVATFPFSAQGGGVTSVRSNEQDGFYLARWLTARMAEKGERYRITVASRGTDLGLADIAVYPPGYAAPAVPADVIPVAWGPALEIRFTILRNVTPLSGQIALGYDHGCAIASDLETYCWGSDGVNVGTFVGVGALGQGTILSTVLGPSKVVGGNVFSQISADDPHTCGLLANGTAMCWGRSAGGELGRGLLVGNNAAPAAVLGGPWKSLSAGVIATCAIDLFDAAWCWGLQQSGVLGTPAAAPGGHYSPLPVAGGLTFQSLALGWVHACGIVTSGSTVCWGSGLSLGGLASDVSSPSPLLTNLTFTSLSAGARHTCGLTPALEAYCWGENTSGQLGDGSVQPSTTPVLVAGGIRFVMLSTSTVTDLGGAFTCGLANTGQAYCWGDNQFGRLGDGTTTNRLTPTPVSTSLLFVSIQAGRDFACGMTAAIPRELYCWGNNSAGELGSGSTGAPSLTPVRVSAPF